MIYFTLTADDQSFSLARIRDLHASPLSRTDLCCASGIRAVVAGFSPVMSPGIRQHLTRVMSSLHPASPPPGANNATRKSRSGTGIQRGPQAKVQVRVPPYGQAVRVPASDGNELRDRFQILLARLQRVRGSVRQVAIGHGADIRARSRLAHLEQTAQPVEIEREVPPPSTAGCLVSDQT
ncbi:hypothetical protein ACIA5E_24940 [Nocardia asteroides]|uniref:hypothetical protein n=1 Tax=Nocardia asteroides TaxID=1824 RepID=UPI0037AF3783